VRIRDHDSLKDRTVSSKERKNESQCCGEKEEFDGCTRCRVEGTMLEEMQTTYIQSNVMSAPHVSRGCLRYYKLAGVHPHSCLPLPM